METHDIVFRPFPADGAQVVYELARERIQAQLTNASHLDDKIATFFSLGTALLAVMSSLLVVGGDTPPASAIVIFSVSADFWILLVGSSMWGYRLQDWKVGPDLGESWDNARHWKEPLLVWWAAEAYTKFYFDNRGGIIRKTRAAECAPWLLASQTLMMSIGLFVFAIS